MKLFKCKNCGKIIMVLKDGSKDTICCGQNMIELIVNTEDAAQEKHVPYMEIKEDKVYVRIGEIEHPMDENHYIEWILCEYEDTIILKKLKPNDKPETYFDYKENMNIYTYCNIHGLWTNSINKN